MAVLTIILSIYQNMPAMKNNHKLYICGNTSGFFILEKSFFLHTSLFIISLHGWGGLLLFFFVYSALSVLVPVY